MPSFHDGLNYLKYGLMYTSCLVDIIHYRHFIVSTVQHNPLKSS